jgi:hypothetical protein
MVLTTDTISVFRMLYFCSMLRLLSFSMLSVDVCRLILFRVAKGYDFCGTSLQRGGSLKITVFPEVGRAIFSLVHYRVFAIMAGFAVC